MTPKPDGPELRGVRFSRLPRGAFGLAVERAPIATLLGHHVFRDMLQALARWAPWLAGGEFAGLLPAFRGAVAPGLFHANGSLRPITSPCKPAMAPTRSPEGDLP